MLRVIFDTNVYGNLVKEKDIVVIEKKIQSEKDFIVYGYKPIRSELRDIPKVTKLSRKTRVRILGLYDRITGGHFLKHSLQINKLAKKYYDYYRLLGGTYGWHTNIRVDFMIVACASFYGLDIVYSEDKHTLLSKHAIKAYNHINFNEYKIRTPNFLNYADLLGLFRD